MRRAPGRHSLDPGANGSTVTRGVRVLPLSPLRQRRRGGPFDFDPASLLRPRAGSVVSVARVRVRLRTGELVLPHHIEAELVLGGDLIAPRAGDRAGGFPRRRQTRWVSSASRSSTTTSSTATAIRCRCAERLAAASPQGQAAASGRGSPTRTSRRSNDRTAPGCARGSGRHARAAGRGGNRQERAARLGRGACR